MLAVKHILYYVVVAFAVVVAGRSVSGAPPSVGLVAEEYAKKYAAIETIRADYSWSYEAIAPEDLLFREQHICFGLPPVKVTIVSHRDGRIYYRSADPSQSVPEMLFAHLKDEFPILKENPDAIYREVPFVRVRAYCQEVAPSLSTESARLIIYDGSRIIEHDESETLTDQDNRARQAYQILNPARFKSSFIPPTLLDRLLLTFIIPELPNETDERRSNRLPDIASEPGVVLHADPQVVDGASCFVIEQPGKQRLFLDPSLAFAPRKREWLGNGALKMETHNQEYEKVSEHVWFPKLAVETHFGSERLANGNYLGKPIFRQRFTVDSIRLNDPRDLALLKVDIPPGSIVIDQTITPLDQDGHPKVAEPKTKNVIPSVGYIQPADKADLDRVVRESRLGTTDDKHELQPRESQWWFVIIANIAVVVIVAIVLIYRRASGK